jgi:LmbE family N-acetylglucosaminyl deacetylase
MNRILVIAAHPDDEILGQGGTVRKIADNGGECYCLILGEGLTSRNQARDMTNKIDLRELKNDTIESSKIIGYKEVFFADLPDNRFDSIDLLDIIKKVEEKIDKIKPDVVLTHFYGDLNIDHRITFEAVMTACRPIGMNSVKQVICFETLSSTEWSFGKVNTTFNPNYFVNITETLKKKIDAMACYKSELRDYPHPRSLESLEISAKKWGTVIGCKYAEAFEIVRKIDI